MILSECCKARIDPVECHVCELKDEPDENCEICKGTGFETYAHDVYECSECYNELNNDGTIA